jgi:uncharacterized protein YndB with AHSA1/START domain
MSDAADGILETRDDGKKVVRFERRLAHPPERVWEALTRPEELSAWWGDADVDLVEGGEFTMRWRNRGPNGEPGPVMQARITELDPPRVLETSGDMHGLLRWELEADPGGGTVLRFTSTLDMPDGYFDTRVLAGWHWHLDALARALEGDRADLVNIWDSWNPIHARYEELAGQAN